jgi:UDP-N-acetylglucosamine--N-acetylmuramyl-(pentapeptide) pyrophosphoryl-undecaprenol N-acetylglucosamine transferase
VSQDLEAKNGRYHIALACGGTGGHIFPGLATAEVLRDRGHEVTLWLAGKSGEGEAVKHWDGKTITIPAEGLAGGFAFKKVISIYRLYRAGRRCLRQMKKDPPDAVLAMGSYASFGPLYAGKRLELPMVLHEANVLPGKAVSLFSKWATAVAASFEETRFYMRRRNLVVTGMPLRRGMSPKTAAITDLGLSPQMFTVLVMGGSRGARAVNEVVSYAVCNLVKRGYELQVIHLTGQADRAMVDALYQDHGVKAWVAPFTHHMSSLYLQADLAISRAGASSCAEIAEFQLPTLLVPYPYAVKDHQTANAKAMKKFGGADMVAQKDLSIDWLEAYISGNMEYSARLQRMRSALQTQHQGSASAKLAELVEITIRRYQRRGAVAAR